MSNIYLKVTIETFSKLRFSGFKKFVTRSVLASRYHWILKLLVATYKSDVWEQNCVWLFYDFNFERSYDVLKSKSSCILLNKNTNLIKTKRNRKWKKAHTVLERRILCFSSYKGLAGPPEKCGQKGRQPPSPSPLPPPKKILC